MTTNTLPAAVQRIRCFAAQDTERSDELLLHAFAATHDESAFAAIVRRHGRLVLGVCRRALGDHHDAEDAFQATFLVLARNAPSIRKGRSLACWLHGVAYRIALKARQEAARRRALPQHAPQPVAAHDEVAWREVQALLDREVNQLPEIYRVPFVLCCLESVGRAEAARRLGIKEGTLSSRLAHARRRIHEALARRGVACPALLAGVADSAVPAELLREAVRGALHGGSAGAISTLAQGTGTTWVRGSLAALLATLVACAIATGLLAHRHSAAADKPAAKTSPPAAGKEAETVEVRGRVLGPDGKPASGAGIAFWATGMPDDRPAKEVAKANDAGVFRFRIASSRLEQRARVIATVKGFAPGWTDLTAAGAGKEVVLRLAKDDVPLTGRLLDLEGKPLEGVTVRLIWVCRHPEEKVAGWIDQFLAMKRKGYYLNEGGLQIARPGLLGIAKSAVTGRDGRFTLNGVGRDRVVTVVVQSEKTASVRLQVPLHDGPRDGWVKGDHGLYPTGFTFLLAPTKPIVGVVRDRKTGLPVAGITVQHSNWHVETTTNAKGEFRLIGAPKKATHAIAVGGRKGIPYLDYTRHNVPDTPGLDPIKVDFELDRGVEISGKVFDAATGKPVRGSVSYFHRSDNPNTKDFISLGLAYLVVGKWGEIQPDGTFTVLGIPGPGVLVVKAADSTRYVRVNAQAELSRLKVTSFPVAATHAVLPIDASEAKPIVHEIKLTPASTRSIRLLDLDGKPVRGSSVVGHTDRRTATKLPGDVLRVPGLSPRRDRAVVVLHGERQLGAVAAVRGGSETPIDVKLRPLVALTGRLVTADGKPLAGRQVLAVLRLDSKKFENLPVESVPVGGISNTAWREFTDRTARTDGEGRFRIEGLLAGQVYALYSAEGSLREENVTHYHHGVKLGEGKDTDVGDVKPRKR